MRKKPMGLIITLAAIFIILLSLVFIIFPPSLGTVPLPTDENGNKIKSGIAEKRFLNVDGQDLGMIILSENIQNPVLLICGGGPGIPEYLMEYMYPSLLYKNFTVCYADYRGTGLSFASEIRAEDMTSERYISDVIEITKYLSKEFNQKKIYILGHSFGTYIALNTVYRYPEYFHSYIAMSQTCSQKESEYLAYDYMKEEYKKHNNKKMFQKFEDCPIRESDEMYSRYFSSSLRDTAMHELGVGTTRDMKSVITGIFFPSLKCKAYTWGQRINLWKGKSNSMKFPVVSDSINFNAFETIKSLEIPVYFFSGKYDYTCNTDLQYKYYESIDSPIKEFYKFENSAHSPIFEEPMKASKIIKEILDSQNRN